MRCTFRSFSAPILCLLATVLPWSQALHAQEASIPTDRADTVVVQDSKEDFVRSVRIDAPNGQVAWEDIFRAIARLQGFADEELRNALPKGTLDLNNRFVSHALMAMNTAFAPHVGFRLAKGDRDQTQLLITVDRESILECQRDIKTEIRQTLVENWPLAEPLEFGLRMDPKWETRDASMPLVVVIHGYNSGPVQAGELLDLPRTENMPCGLFHYPNDQSIAESAQLLSRELKELAKTAQGRDVVLVTHSMGGVLARETIENPKLDPGNVSRLIMISPPNQGSQLARFAILMDLWEFLGALLESDEYRSVFAAVEDGLGEASVDLEPGSVFLTRLNRRDRNPNVKYSILTGVAAPIPARDLQAIRNRLNKLAERSRWLKFMVSKCDRVLADLDEVIDGRGDGVVSYKRARLKGVDDTIALRFGHNQPIAVRRFGDAKRLHHEVMKRIVD